MKVGLIARAENRGLGTMTWDWARHMEPDRTLVVIPDGVRHAHLQSHLDRYPGATVLRFGGELDERVCREWLDGLDVVYTAETFYDWQFCRWAHKQHVATVCHVMPEWMPQGRACEPTAWWAPTSWMLSRLPEGTKHVPVPIATDRFPALAERSPGPFRWLHVAGAQTHHDRNGTQALLQAARALTADQQILIRSQTPGIAAGTGNVIVETGDLPNYWDAYVGVDALVMPRRYAGLCLPALEAFGAGLPVIMSDMAPQNVDWPVCTTETAAADPIRMMGGRIPTGDADPAALAALMDQWATDPLVVAWWQLASQDYAEQNSWAARASQISAELEQVADRVAA